MRLIVKMLFKGKKLCCSATYCFVLVYSILFLLLVLTALKACELFYLLEATKDRGQVGERIICLCRPDCLLQGIWNAINL